MTSEQLQSALRPQPAALRTAVSEALPGVLVVSPFGEMDLATAGGFRETLHDAVDSATARHVVVDLSGLTFCGSTGLVVLVEARQRAAGRGVGFRVAGAARTVRRVLEITGLGTELGLGGDVHELLAELAGP